MVLSLGLDCWAVTHDLPYSGVDEPTFVRPPVHMAATGDFDPHWFGHPGSTTIYPLAGIYHGWDAVAHGAPVSYREKPQIKLMPLLHAGSGCWSPPRSELRYAACVRIAMVIVRCDELARASGA